jgi:pSer/pThr/pTyr-binding forkhead associated (FHA) protein
MITTAMTDERVPEGTEPQVEVETDPTVTYLPISDREAKPLTPDEAADVEGLEGYALVVARGPSAGVTYVLAEGNTTVGRHPESGIFLNDVTVSRQHCRFLVGPDSVSVEDSGSTNGTYVNDQRVDASELEAGDEVVIGRFHFLLAHGDA